MENCPQFGRIDFPGIAERMTVSVFSVWRKFGENLDATNGVTGARQVDVSWVLFRIRNSAGLIDFGGRAHVRAAGSFESTLRPLL